MDRFYYHAIRFSIINVLSHRIAIAQITCCIFDNVFSLRTSRTQVNVTWV